MVKHARKKQFIKLIAEVPLVTSVCNRVGISRQTYYRWKKEDKEFREKTDEALDKGRHSINDLAEGTVINLIKEKNFPATKFWLQNNHSSYNPNRKDLEAEEKMKDRSYYSGYTDAMEEIAENMRGKKKKKEEEEVKVNEKGEEYMDIGDERMVFVDFSEKGKTTDTEDSKSDQEKNLKDLE